MRLALHSGCVLFPQILEQVQGGRMGQLKLAGPCRHQFGQVLLFGPFAFTRRLDLLHRPNLSGQLDFIDRLGKEGLGADFQRADAGLFIPLERRQEHHRNTPG